MAPRLPSPVFPKIASAVDELFEDATLPLSNEEVTARHSGLWFGDGNVILQTDDLQFRVYKGVLAKNSVVFRDMFATASSSECPIVDGCPVVLLYDWPEDLEHVLLALFDWSSVAKKPMDWHVLAAMITLGRKYAMDSLLRHAMEVLCKTFPTHWSVPYDGADRWETADPGTFLEDGWQDDIFQIMQFAVEEDIRHILPALYLHAYNQQPFEAVYRHNLPPQIIESWSTGYVRFTHKLSSAFDWMNPVIRDCDHDICLEQINLAYTAIVSTSRQDVNMRGLRFLMANERKVQWIRLSSCCQACQKGFRLRCRNVNMYLWKELPQLCGLGKWEELRRQRQDDLTTKSDM